MSLGPKLSKQRLGGFINRMLRQQEATHCQLQDGFLQRVNGFGAVEQQVEVGGDAVPVGGQFIGRGAFGQRAEQRANSK